MSFRHFRIADENSGGFQAKGGYTVYLEDIQDWVVDGLTPGTFFDRKFAVARCHPKENFSKSFGRDVALQKAKTIRLTVREVFLTEKGTYVVFSMPNEARLLVFKKRGGKWITIQECDIERA